MKIRTASYISITIFPGILSQINSILAQRGINILGQYLHTTPEVGYVVFDIEKDYKNNIIEELKEKSKGLSAAGFFTNRAFIEAFGDGI